MSARVRSLLACAVTLPLLSWGVASAVPAEGEAGQGALRADVEHLVIGSLGANGNAVDGWSLTCPAGTHHAHFDIKDYSSGGPTIGIVGFDYSTGNATIRRAPQGGLSATAQLNNGPGEYDFYIFKAGGAAGTSANYDSLQLCHNSSHGEVGGTHGLIQNQ
jgi:hypothetical protein